MGRSAAKGLDVANNGRNLGFYQEFESTVDKLYLASRR